jgi:hypothetical protein
VVEGSMLTTADERQLSDDLARSCARLWARAGGRS